MRQTSVLFRRAAFSNETTEVILCLLTFSHPSLPETIRVVNSLDDIVSGGHTYVAFPFEITLPSEVERQVPVAQLRIDNTDRRIVEAVRSVNGQMQVTMQIVLASQPDTVEWSYEGFKLTSATYDEMVVEGELRLEEVLVDPFPQHSYTPGWFPALYPDH